MKDKWIVAIQMPAQAVVSVEETEEAAEEMASFLTDDDCVLVYPCPEDMVYGQYP